MKIPASDDLMHSTLDLQIVTDFADIPASITIQQWLTTLFVHLNLSAKEITVRIVDEQEIQQLNLMYRGKDKPTNVLSFPFEAPEIPENNDAELNQSIDNYVGDLVVCAQVVQHESLQQNKQLEHHFAHMIIHGALHLLGYDHIEEQEAEEMEGIEITVLKKLAIDDPYLNH